MGLVDKILKEAIYTDEQNQAYYAKKESMLPPDANFEGLKKIVGQLNKNKFGLNFIYSLPYPDSNDKRNLGKHKAIPNMWWTTITIEGVNEFYGRLKLVNRGDGRWK